jgi:hypothetical protein
MLTPQSTTVRATHGSMDDMRRINRAYTLTKINISPPRHSAQGAQGAQGAQPLHIRRDYWALFAHFIAQPPQVDHERQGRQPGNLTLPAAIPHYPPSRRVPVYRPLKLLISGSKNALIWYSARLSANLTTAP